MVVEFGIEPGSLFLGELGVQFACHRQLPPRPVNRQYGIVDPAIVWSVIDVRLAPLRERLALLLSQT